MSFDRLTACLTRIDAEYKAPELAQTSKKHSFSELNCSSLCGQHKLEQFRKLRGAVHQFHAGQRERLPDFHGLAGLQGEIPQSAASGLLCGGKGADKGTEYERLLKAAGKNEQLRLVMETICSTGIRVSELKYFTAEAVRRGEVIVRCKAKTRTILLPGKLRRLLLDYAGKQKIRSGVIFLTGCGKPYGRR